jgi:saccharopine dehydrogenase-like NADP-dependent oxidoreductase
MADNPPLLAAASNTPEMRYSRMYIETIDALNTAISKFDLLARVATDAGVRSDARARYLEALRDKHMTEQLYRAWQRGTDTTVHAPSQEVLDATIKLAKELADVTTSEKKLTKIIELFTGVATAFTKLHPNAPAPA